MRALVSIPILLLLGCGPAEDPANPAEADTDRGADPGPSQDTPWPEDTGITLTEGFSVTPEAIAFDEVGVGCEVSDTIVVQLQGSSELAFRASLVTGSDDPRFSLPDDLPDRLAPGQRLDVPVAFVAKKAGPHRAAVALYAGDDLFPFAEVTLGATARDDLPCP